MQNNQSGSVYFMGIAGTGMAAVAGLCQEAGWKVSGSDVGIYPPMSTMLEELGIPVATPYNAENINRAAPDLVVVANALSRGNVEIEHMLLKGCPYTSFPALLGDFFLGKRHSIVVAGTHGKTTTTSLLASVLDSLGEDPGFMIGGLPKNFPRSFRLGQGKFFAIEGDEYDTAFFDKGPKFLHYRPKSAILNNVEFDHADIYPNVEAIEKQFVALSQLVDDPSLIVANVDDPGIARVLASLPFGASVTPVATLGRAEHAKIAVESIGPASGGARDKWQGTIRTARWGKIRVETCLSGAHNMANIAQVIGCLQSLADRDLLSRKLDGNDVVNAIASFEGVARRLDHLGSYGNIDVYEDFAHHPTAVALVIESFRRACEPIPLSQIDEPF